MLDIPDWDFHWQGGYELAAPMTVGPGDHVLLQCWWDNSAANQPLGDDDVPREPQYTEWGEGTGDEMCFDFVLAYPIDQIGNRNCGIVF